MKNIVFVFFDPWSIHQNYHYHITKNIIERDFELIRYCFKRISDSDIEHIYRKNTPINNDRSWHIPKQIYTMGVSCGLLFSFSQGKDGYTELKNLKGRSQPLLNQIGTFRYDYKAPNKSLSLLHSSDDFESTLSEGSIFFSNFESKSVTKEQCTNNFFSDFHEPSFRLKQTSAIKLLLHLRLRILELIEDNSTFFNCSTEIALINTYLKVDFNVLSVREETEVYLNFVSKEEDIINPILSILSSDAVKIPQWYSHSVNIGYLLEGLRILNDINNYPFINSESFIQNLPIFYDKWEEVLFKTTLFHFPELTIQS